MANCSSSASCSTLAGLASVLQEALDEQFATLDYTLKANKRFATKWLGRLTGRK